MSEQNACRCHEGQEASHSHSGAGCAGHGHCGQDGCGCGHSHGGESAGRLGAWATAAGVALVAAAALLPLLPAAPWMAAAGTLLAGYPLFSAGIRGLVTSFTFDELTLMTVAAAASMGLAVVSDHPMEPLLEAAAVTLLFRLGSRLEQLAVGKSRRDIEALTNIRPDTATVLAEDGSRQELGAEAVAVGARILLKPGERVAIDCEVLTGEGSVDLSVITGEPLPAAVSQGARIPSGAINLDGLLTCRTTERFEDSAASRIIRIVEESAAHKGSAERLISRFAKVYTPAVLIAALLLALAPPLLGLGAFSVWLPRALVFLVASCPCALVISVPLTFFAGAGAASRAGVLVKGTRHLETLAKADCVVFDKTGTLTRGVPSVGKMVTDDGFDKADLLRLAGAVERNSSHPAARAVAAFAGESDQNAADLLEHPGRGVSATVEGRKILCGSPRLLEEAGVGLGGLPAQGILLAVNGRAACAFLLTDEPRPRAKEAVGALRRLGVRQLSMLTGDGEQAASAVAANLGLDSFHARLLPQDKVVRVRQIREHCGTTLFVGDGINDAPVLAAADAGVAMGLGTDAAIEAADVVLMHERLTALPDAVLIARRTVRKARQNIAFALAVKLVVLALGVMGLASMWMAVFADTGVTLLTVLNAATLLTPNKRLS